MIKIVSANSADIDRIKAAADVIEEVDELITYLGFCAPGTTATNVPAWSILKIEQSGAVLPILTTQKWATGLCAYNLIWDNRAAYQYTFKNF